MDGDEIDRVAGDLDALLAALGEERLRHLAGVEPDPRLRPLFAAHPGVAHRETIAALRAAGRRELADRVAALRAERTVAGLEERWRAAEASAVVAAPDGPIPLGEAERRLPREADRSRRLSLAAAIEVALGPAARDREEAAEAQVRARAEGGLVPGWERVIAGERLLAATDDAYGDLLAFVARRDLGLDPAPRGDLRRPDLLRLAEAPALDRLFGAAGLAPLLRDAAGAIGVDPGALRIDRVERPAARPGAHLAGARVLFRPRGGLGDWQDLLDAAARAAAAAPHRPSGRDAAFGAAVGWLLAGLLLEPRFLAGRVGVERRQAADLVRALALRALVRLRIAAAALRVATEVERGLSGAAWREAHREAVGAAAQAAWEGVRASRDADPAPLAAALDGCARGEALRAELRERFDEDWWRNPRTRAHLAGLLAGGRFPGEGVRVDG